MGLASEAKLSQAEALAVAVLRGDHDAALLLADEVLMTFQRTGKMELPDLKSLDLPVRARKALRRSGISTTAQLIAQRERDLLELRNFGEVTLLIVREKLAAAGLKLAGR